MVRRLVLIAALLTCVTAYAIENIVWIDFTQPIELSGGTWRNVPAVSASWIDPDYATLNALWYLDGPVRTSTIPTEEPSVTNVLQCSSVSTELRDWGAYGSYRTWTTVNAVFFDPSSIGNAMDGKSNVSVSCWVQRLNSSYSDGIFSFDYANREWEMRYNIVGDGTIYSDLNGGVNEWNFNVSSWWSATTDTGKWVFITATFDGTTERIYGNGILRASRSENHILELTGTETRVGASGTDVWQDYLGPVWIHTQTLSLSEHSNAWAVGYMDATRDDLPTDDLILYAGMGSNTLSFTDSSSNNANMELRPNVAGGPSTEVGWTNAAGNVVRVARFTGGNYMRRWKTRGTSLNVPGTNNFRISCWAKAATFPTTSTYTGLFAQGNLTSANQISISILPLAGTTNIRARINTSAEGDVSATWAVSTPDYVVGEWYLMSIIRTGNTLYLMVDDVIRATGDSTGFNLVNQDNYFQIGTAGYQDSWDGWMARVDIDYFVGDTNKVVEIFENTAPPSKGVDNEIRQYLPMRTEP